MSGRTVLAILQAKIDGYTGPLREAAKATDALADAAEKAGKKADESFKPGKLRPVAAEWEKLQDTAINQKEAWNDVAGGLLKAGAAATVGMGLVVREYATFDQAMSGVASTGDDARQSIDMLREAATKSGADTAFSATEAAQGIEELARAGVSAEDTLGGGLSGALDLAAAGQLEVADAAGIASIAMTQFKLKGDQIPHLADLLAAGAGKAMGGVDDLGMALKQGGLVASQFGLSIEETVGGLSAFAASGLLGSDAGTSLKTMLLKLADPSKEAKRTMDELGISAYDAQGKFVGLEGLAGQLKESMIGLDDSQRQAALSTIFGTDAIRAAAILYEEGAEGIADWTKAVDDSGYAAKTAATLQDNLVGDLEKLGGAWSALAIQMGESADGPLRGLVQGLTSIVDLATEFPDASKAIFTVVGVVGGLALATGGLMKGVGALAQYRTNLAAISDTSPGLGRAVGVLGKLPAVAAGAAAAFAALVVIGAVTENLWGLAPAAEAASAALERLNQGQGVGVIDSLFRTTDGRDIAQGVGDLKAAFDVLSGIESGMKLDWISNDFWAHVFQSTSQLDRLKTQFAQIDSQFANMDTKQAAAAFREIAEVSQQAGLSTEGLIELFPEYAAQIDSMAASSGYAKLSTEELFTAMRGGGLDGVTKNHIPEIVTGINAWAEAALAAGGVQADLGATSQANAEQIAAASKAASDAISAYQGLRDAIQGVNDAQREGANLIMSEEQARETWLASLAAVDEQIKKNGKSLNETEEKGRANREFLRGLAVDARDVTDAMRDNGAGVDVLNAKMSEQREEFIKTAAKFGIVGAAAQKMADDYGLIPNYVETLMVVEGAKVSKQEAADLNKQLEGLPDAVKSEIVTIAHRDGAEEAQRALDSIPPEVLKLLKIDPDTAGAAEVQRAIDAVHGKTVTVTVRNITVGGTSAPAMGRTELRAQGGYIRGPGTTTSDSIPAMLSDQEYVLRAAAVQAIGVDRLHYMNRHGELPRFADGGLVSQRATSGALSMAAPSYASTTTHVTNINLEGREALTWVMDNLRDGQRRAYQERGVH